MIKVPFHIFSNVIHGKKKQLNFVRWWQNVKYVLIYVDVVLVTCDLLLKKQRELLLRDQTSEEHLLNPCKSFRSKWIHQPIVSVTFGLRLPPSQHTATVVQGDGTHPSPVQPGARAQPEAAS